LRNEPNKSFVINKRYVPFFVKTAFDMNQLGLKQYVDRKPWGDYTIRKILGQISHEELDTYLHVTRIISRRLKIAPSLEILILLSDRFHLSAVWLSVARRP